MTDWKKIISEWNTPAMAVFATELVCGKCHNEMGAVIFEKEESLNNFTQSNNEKLCESCVQELKKAVKDCKTPMDYHSSFSSIIYFPNTKAIILCICACSKILL